MGCCGEKHSNSGPEPLITPTKIVVVTGASSGIGYHIVKRLIYDYHSYILFLTARDLHKGTDAVRALDPRKLYADRLLFMPLDVTNQESVKRLKRDLQSQCGYIDVLVNNAGINPEGWDFSASRERSVETAILVLRTNFYGAVSVTEALLPLFREDGLILNIGSRLGKLREIPGDALRKRLADPSLTQAGLMQLAQEFVDAMAAGNPKEAGWPEHSFVVSKVLLHAYTRVLARRLGSKVRVHAACPGWCRTNTGGPLAPNLAESGCKTPVHIITSHSLHDTGQFWEDSKLSSFD